MSRSNIKYIEDTIKESLNVIKLPYQIIEQVDRRNVCVKNDDNLFFHLDLRNLKKGISPSFNTCLNKISYTQIESNKIHGYDKFLILDLWNEKDMRDKTQTYVKILCNTCGTENNVWRPNHLRKSGGHRGGCLKCKSAMSSGTAKLSFIKVCNTRNQGTGYLYVIKCNDDGESFVKVGITCHEQSKTRFNSKNKLPYSHEEVLVIGGNAGQIFDLERKVLGRFFTPESKYFPVKEFSGYMECFKENCLADILEFINVEK